MVRVLNSRSRTISLFKTLLCFPQDIFSSPFILAVSLAPTGREYFVGNFAASKSWLMRSRFRQFPKWGCPLEAQFVIGWNRQKERVTNQVQPILSTSRLGQREKLKFDRDGRQYWYCMTISHVQKFSIMASKNKVFLKLNIDKYLLILVERLNMAMCSWSWWCVVKLILAD